MRLNENRCPNCDHLIDGVRDPSSGVPDCTPNIGDVSVCAYCGEILEFDENLKSIKVTEKTLSEFTSEQLDNIKMMSYIFKGKLFSND